MIAQELSPYPVNYDDDDQRRLEQHVQAAEKHEAAEIREAPVGILGSFAVLTVSGGVLETGTPDRVASPEKSVDRAPETTRSLGKYALSNILERDESQLSAAIAYQKEMADVTQNKLELAA